MSSRRVIAGAALVLVLAAGLAWVLATRGGPASRSESEGDRGAGKPAEAGIPGLARGAGEGPGPAAGATSLEADGAPAPGRRVRVVDGATGAALAEARIAPVTDASTSDLAYAGRTDAEGRASIDLPPGAYVIVVADGRLPWRGTLPAGGEELVVRLEPGVAMRGTVVDEEGKGVERVVVLAHHVSNRVGYPMPSFDVLPHGDVTGAKGLTGADGTFEITGVSPGGRYQLDFYKPFWTTWTSGPRRVVLATPEGAPTKIVMRPVAEIVVRVRLPKGVPALAWAVTLEPSRGVEPIPLQEGFEALLQEDVTFEEYRPRDFVFRYVRATSEAWGPRGDAPNVNARLYGRGIHTVSMFGALVFGASNRIELDASPVGELSPVTLRAGFRGGRPYDGALLVGVQGDLPSTVPTQTVLARFVEGVAEKALALPVGPHRLLPRGSGLDGPTWTPAGPPRDVEIPAGGKEQVVELVLEGNPVAFDVRAPDGAPARGFGLTVDSGEHVVDWDRRLVAPRGLWRLDPSPHAWLTPGGHVLDVNLPGVGRARTSIHASGDGTPIPLRLVLVAGQDFLPPELK